MERLFIHYLFILFQMMYKSQFPKNLPLWHIHTHAHLYIIIIIIIIIIISNFQKYNMQSIMK